MLHEPAFLLMLYANFLCRYFIPQPKFRYLLVGNLYQCELTLPPNAAFRTISGPESRSTHLAKQLACLEACKKLHQIGALNDHLLPFNEEPAQNNSRPNSKASTSGAGRNVTLSVLYKCTLI